MNSDSKISMASGPTPPKINKACGQGFHVPALPADRARLTAGPSQTRPSMSKNDDHRLAAGKLWGITSLAMPSEPCVCKRRSGLVGTNANGGWDEKGPVQEKEQTHKTRTHNYCSCRNIGNVFLLEDGGRHRRHFRSGNLEGGDPGKPSTQ